MTVKINYILIFIFAGILSLTTAYGHCSQEQNGNVVIQAEETSLTPNWKFGNDVEGYSGRGYITWFGANQYEFQGEGTLKYKVCVSGGMYKINIWSMRLKKHGLRKDEGNDAWMKVGEDWIKLFTSFGTNMNLWKLSMLFDINGEKEEPLVRLDAGCQPFEIAARSEMYSLDRFILVKVGSELDMKMGVTTCTDQGHEKMEPNGSDSSDDDALWNSTIQAPKCVELQAQQLPDRKKPVTVTFLNMKGYPIQIYKRTPKNKLIFLEEINSNTPSSAISVRAHLYDRFAATRTDGTCLRNRMVVGVTGKMDGDGALFTVI